MRLRATFALGLLALILGFFFSFDWPGPSWPAHRTMEEALSEQQVSIAYHEPFSRNRTLVLFRTEQHPGPSAALLERTLFGRWRRSGSFGLNGSLRSLGALSYGRANLGFSTVRKRGYTTQTVDTHIIFGEVLDPAITWVEATLDSSQPQTVQATVSGGVWLVHVSPKEQNTPFDLRAGDTGGQRFAANYGRSAFRRYLDPVTALMSEYQDASEGIRLEHPLMFSLRVDQAGRRTWVFHAWTITVERKPQVGGQMLEKLLEAAAATAGTTVLEHAIRPLGSHRAGYLLESRPDKSGEGSTYTERYLVLEGGDRYEVTCSTVHVYARPFWERELKPVCDRVMQTVRLGR